MDAKLERIELGVAMRGRVKLVRTCVMVGVDEDGGEVRVAVPASLVTRKADYAEGQMGLELVSLSTRVATVEVPVEGYVPVEG